jgi:hypothetical protein
MKTIQPTYLCAQFRDFIVIVPEHENISPDSVLILVNF